MNEILNPYIAGAPVTDTRMFFGREDIFEWIERNLTGQYADHILVIHGQRRVGKTSVLKQLPNRLPERYIPVFFDLQGRTRTSLDRFLWWLAREIVRVLKQDRGVTIPLPEKEAFSEDPEYLESRFLPSLQDPLAGRRLLLTFDEFDTLEEEEIRETLGRPLVDYLRRLMGREGLNFIFSIGSSGRKLENMQASYTEFFKTALYKKVSFLSREQAHYLITSPVEGVLRYERDAVDRIVEITSGHPYFTQLICHELFALSQRGGSAVIRRHDLESVLDEVVERGTVNLKFVWDEASDLEKWVLAGLAHAEGKPDSRAVADFLKKQRVRFSPPDLEGALLHLREKDVLTEGHGFVIHLLRLWLVRNRPLQQVREELTEVNPIANRYIEIGHEYQESGQYAKALESYREALGVDADNILAQVSIANVYLQQKSYSEAVAEFERALAIDEEDVAARAGLCQTHLLLGDQAVAAGRAKDAIRSYQKVLAINAEHTEARQRMADIKRQQAERSLADGKDEEALAAFKEAMGYTPEDQALEARYAEVVEERKARILANLLVRAEKELGAKQWDRAAGTLKSGLELAPNDERFTRVLQRTQQAQREERIAGLRSRAAQAARQERWDEAIVSLEQALKIDSGLQELEGQLAEARRQQRKSRVSTLRARALTATRAEKFDEALAAWGELLTLLPEEESTIRAEMQSVEKRQAWATAYSQAQAAMAKRNYERAIALLKGIVLEDETYKDASRLMAEAIELRRTARKFWQSKWLWAGAGGAVLAVLGWILLRPGSPVLLALSAPGAVPATNAAQTSPPPPTWTAAQPPTLAPTAMPTAVPWAWGRITSGQDFERDTVIGIVVDPADPGVLYAATSNAGIYKSIDGGISWQPALNGLGRAWVMSLVIDPIDPNRLYAGTSLGGVYKTSDAANSWQEANVGMEEIRGWEAVSQVAMDPTGGVLYFTNSGQLYRSDDGGGNWSRIMPDCPFNIVGLGIDQPDPGFVYTTNWSESSTCPTGLYRGEAGDNASALLDLQLPYGGFWKIVVAPYQAGELAPNVYVYDQGNIYESNSRFQQWVRHTLDGCSILAVDPSGSGGVYCAQSAALFQQIASEWEMRSTLEGIVGDATALVVSPHNPDLLYVGAHGLWVSSDRGRTWTEQGSGLGATRMEIRVQPQTEALFVEDERCNVRRSADGGRTWENLGAWCGLTFSPDGKTLYTNGGLFEDAGKTWRDFRLPPGELNHVLAHPRIAAKLFAVYGRSNPPYIYTSVDNGTTWTPTRGMGDIHDGRLFFDPGQGQRVFAIGDMEAFRSDDGGENWVACERTGSWHARGTSRAVVDPRDSDRLLLATRGDGVLITEDGCQSWRQSNDGLGRVFVSSLATDPRDPQIVYAGTDGGAYVSFDGGESWGPINDGLLGATVVYSIVVDPQSNVYAATPYGVFKLEAK